MLGLPLRSSNPDLADKKYIAAMFGSSEQGVWYDPSDLSTMFQDAAGRIPVTGVSQPVGLMLDKSKGLVLGAELFTQPVNFASEWIATLGGGPVASGNSFTTSSFGGFWINKLTAGKTYQVTVAGSTTASSVTLRQTNTIATAEIRAGFGSAIFTALTGYPYFYIRNESAGTATVSNISVRELPGNHATQTTTASRPTLQIDTAGNYCLSFDGVDDWMVTPSINFTATDKMTVMAGVRKLSDSNTGGLIELSNNVAVNSGSFALFAPSTSGSYGFFSKGTSGVQSAGTGSFAPAPDTSVVSGIGNISGDITSIRRNGYAVETKGLDQGGENYGNYPLYIGRRANAYGPFNGRLYGLIVRGAATDDSHLTHAEKYLAYKSGVSL